MHSHDRTLIASLGFADPDKKNPLHDLACVYIAQRGIEIVNYLMPLVPCEGIATFYKMIENKGDFFSGVAPHLAHERVYFTVETDLVNSVTCKSISFEMEKIITHRNRDYRRDIGFMDVCLYGNRTIDFNQQSVCAKFGRDDLKEVEMARSGDFSLAFEVKTTPGSTYDAIRQIKLYKQYIDRPGYDYWVLATTFPISEAEKFALKNEGILWLQLGPKFSKWASEQT